jgi:hypothetical protein
VLADSDTFGTSPQHLDDSADGEGGVCCGGASKEADPAAASCC